MILTSPTATEIERTIRNIPDFPKPGIQFKDITPVLADARLFAGCIDLLTSASRRARWMLSWALMRVDSSSQPPPP